MKNSFYLSAIILLFLIFSAKSEVVEKRQKVNLPEEAKIIDFYYDGINYYVLYETEAISNDYTGKETTFLPGEKVQSKQKLIFNGKVITEIVRKYYIWWDAGHFVKETTDFEFHHFDSTKYVMINKIKEGETYLHLNEQKLGPYSEVLFHGFLANGNVVYSYKQKGKWFTSIEGKKFGPFDDKLIANFSLQKKNFVLIGTKNKKKYLITPTQEQGPYDGIDQIVWLKNERTFACVANNNNRFLLILEDQKFGPFEMIYSYGFIENENLPIYKAKINNKWFLFTNNEKFGPFEEIYFVGITENEKLPIYKAKINAKWYLFVDKENFGSFDYIEAKETLIKNKNSIIYEARIKNKYYLIINNQKFGPYDSLQLPNKVKNIDNIVYGAKVNDYWFVFIGNKKIGPFSDLKQILSDENGERFAYQVVKGNSIYFYEGEKVIRETPIPEDDFPVEYFDFYLLWQRSINDFVVIEASYSEAGDFPSSSCNIYKNNNLIGRLEYFDDIAKITYLNGKVIGESYEYVTYEFPSKIDFSTGEEIEEESFVGKFIDNNSFYFYDNRTGELVYVKF